MYYSDEITDLMRKHHQSLSEKDQRKYAAIEAVKLGYGGNYLHSPSFGSRQEYNSQGN
jgi:hypothetical protein